MTHRRPLAASALLLAVVAARADAQQYYPQTLYYGAGLIDIPVAWVSPVNGDFALGMSAVSFHNAKASANLEALNGLNTNGAVSVSLFGRAELGWAVYSDNPEWGFFGQGLIIDQEQFRRKVGAIRWMPSIAVGLRNVGPYDKIDRYTLGYTLRTTSATDPTRIHEADSVHQKFSTGETVYGVLTKSFALNEIKPSWGNTNISITVGYGNGLFKDDGGLGDLYSNHSWGGVFAGIKTDFNVAQYTVVSLLGENDAWGYNLGAMVDWHGLRASLYWLDIGASSPDTATSSATHIYGYSKWGFSLGWASNVLGLVHGDLLQKKVTELTAERDQLQAEINARQQRIVALELEINRYEAQNLLELEQRRAQAEQELRAERDALQRLEERLKRLEQNAPPGSVTPPR